MDTADMLRIYLLDDHAMVRYGLVELLERDGFATVAEAVGTDA